MGRVRRRGVLLVACAAICWSSGGLIARLVTTGPWTTSLWRGLFASLFLALVLWIVRRRNIVGQWREGGAPVLIAAVCMATASTCFIFALSRTSVANTAILMSTGPFVAGLLGWILLGERVAPRTWLAMGVALAGAVIMVSSSYGRGALAGDLLAVVMAGSFATATVLVRRHPEIQMAPAAALATALTALVALPLADPLATAPRDLALLAFFGVGQFGAGAAGLFQSPPSRPPLALLVAVAGPPLVFAVVYRASDLFRRFALGLDLRLLTAIQAWRVIGVMFLALYAFGLLPGLFAWPAGVGDVVVGLAAPFVLLAMLRETPTWRRQVAWLNIAGLLDFVGAVGTGVLTSTSSLGFAADAATRASLGALPLSLVPTFAVPLWIIFHVISLLQLRAAVTRPHTSTITMAA